MLQNLLSVSSVLSIIGSIVIAVLVLLATITVHELGHYIVGKIFKFKINEFAIGMGPAIYKKVKKNGEIFSIRIFPLGGFCAFEGEDEDNETVKKANEKAQAEYQQSQDETSIEPQEQKSAPVKKELSKDAFNNKKPWQRILVLIAGGVVNLIFAILIVVFNFACFGHTAYEVAEIRPNDEYSTYTLAKGDLIEAIDGNYIYMSVDIINALKGKKKNDIVAIDIVRDGKPKKVEVMLRNDVDPSGLTDYSDVFSALGVGTVPMVTAKEDSIFPNGEYLLRFNDNETYTNCTRIYDYKTFFDYLSTKKAGESVGIWITTDDETAVNGRTLLEITLSEAWDSIDKTDYEALGEFFSISIDSYSYQVSTTTNRVSFGELFYRPVVYAYKTVSLTFVSIGGLFNGTVPINSVTGPIGTISLTAEYVQYGFNYLLEIAALIGISVGIFNLLPIPALDGARAVFVLIEWIRGKPINRNVEGIIHMVGLFLLLGIAIFFDILQFI